MKGYKLRKVCQECGTNEEVCFVKRGDILVITAEDDDWVEFKNNLIYCPICVKKLRNDQTPTTRQKENE